MSRSDNVAVFEHTQKVCKENEVIYNAVKEARKRVEVFAETQILDPVEPKYKEEAMIVFSQKRSFEAASAYKRQKVCVLNFASHTNPGGGVMWGSSAQEEALCRCSTLFLHLTDRKVWPRFYGPHRQSNNTLYNDDCIYTPDVIVFKTDTLMPRMLPENKWWTVDVISCAAPNLRKDNMEHRIANISDEDLFELHKKRMRRILDIAALKGVEVMILGAFGCGAFKNPPDVVARALKEVAEEYKHHFKTIEFAVYCPERDKRNFESFQKALEAN